MKTRSWSAIVAMLAVGSLVCLMTTLLLFNSPALKAISGSRETAAIGRASGYGFSTRLVDLPDAELSQRLLGMKAAGATWVRYDLSWNGVQPVNDYEYNWAPYDRVTRAARDAGLEVLLIIDLTPVRERSANCPNSELCPPANAENFGRFAGAAARHYQSYGVRNWEIWNEPNISYRFRPAANPEQYVAMLKSAYTAIKQVDPNMTVIAASTAPSATDRDNLTPTDFLRAIYAAGAQGYFDAISAHPYAYPVTPAASSQYDAWGQLPAMHTLMSQHGDGAKQIWITEFGAPTNGPNLPGEYVSEAVQAQIAAEAIAILQEQTWAGPLFWYDYQDSGTSRYTSENFFGLVRADGSFKPAYYVFKEAANQSKDD